MFFQSDLRAAKVVTRNRPGNVIHRITLASSRMLPAVLLTAAILAAALAGTARSTRAQENPREGECANNPFPDINPGPGSLKGLRPVDPPNLGEFIRDRQAAIALGKALFWDQQVGSDGLTSCASCHFRGGADPRSINQIAPGGENNTRRTFEVGGPNFQLQTSNFPLHRLLDPNNRRSTVLQSFDDVISSQGVKLFDFIGVIPGQPKDQGRVRPDPVFHIGGLNTRRVEPRNTPTVINAAFNRRNFWDGRADPIFNGVNAFGVRDPNARVLKRDSTGRITAVKIRIEPASAASQAVAPVTSNLEMSFDGRIFPNLGKKLVAGTPLLLQKIAYDDSVLGRYSRSTPTEQRPGLTLRYETLIQAAFQNVWWFSTDIVVVNADGTTTFVSGGGRELRSNEFTMMQYNFALFYGLAIQLYEATLISDDAPVDRYFDGNRAALNPAAVRGLALFSGQNAAGNNTACAACHAGAEFTNASTRIILGAEGQPAEVIERMNNGTCNVVIYDQSFYNIGVRPTAEDLGIGNRDPFGNPFSIARLLTSDPNTIPSKELLTIRYPNIANPPPRRNERVGADGAFKVPSLRNISLTAPYFHNGGHLTLKQVVQFYNRGSDFRDANIQNIDFEIGRLELTEPEIDDLVAFLESLTDQRVVRQAAPFDHPQLFVPNGHRGNRFAVEAETTDSERGTARDIILEIPAVGRNGGPLPKGFLEQ